MQKTRSVLKTFFGFDSFRPLQEQIIDHLLNRQSCLVLMPTGGGKSICYQVPALVMEGTALVISPLIALMKDQVESLRSNGVKAAYLNSSLSREQESEVLDDCYNGVLKLLYISPEKALSLTESFLKRINVSLIAIDEAHCISQWGHDFRPEYTRLNAVMELFPGVPVVALTATADKTTRNDILKQLNIPEARIFISSFDRPNIRLEVKPGRKKKDKMQELIRFIGKRHGTSGIIYCLSRKGTETVAGELRRNGIACEFYHAGMNTEDRSRVQELFIRDEVKIICATIAFGMGIDKSNIRWVVHYNLPSKIEGYYQEIGRAGRDGMKSDALLFYSLSDLMMLTRFAEESGQPELNKEKLLRMQQFAEARMCRRKILLNYFGETMLHNCNNCDVCASPPPVIDGTVAAQKALSAVIRTGEKESISMIIQVLRGSSSKDVTEKGYHEVKTWGSGKEHSFETWQSFLLQFIQAGLLEMAYDEGFALKVTGAGRKVLAGELKVEVTESRRVPVFEDDPDDEMNEISSPLSRIFDDLKRLRAHIARREDLPPYIIFTDKTLFEMATRMPLTADAMLRVPGVSINKFNKYGEQFLTVLNGHATDEQRNSIVDPAAVLTDENIEKWAGEMEQLKLQITPTSIAKALAGSDDEHLISLYGQLSFFRLLEGTLRFTGIRDRIRQYFEKKGAETARHASDYFFNAEPFNHLSEETISGLKSAVAGLPMNRPSDTIDNNYILEARKTHPRSYEHWHEPEISIFKSVVTQTNQLELIADIFQRSPDSIKSYYKKAILKPAELNA